MKKLSTAVLVVFALDVMMGLAQSQSLQITGTAGYLSEFELSGTVTERTSSGRTEFFGPLLWKHVGLCSADGPQEKRGDIKFEMSRAGSLSQIDATISFEGMQCRYKGPVFWRFRWANGLLGSTGRSTFDFGQSLAKNPIGKNPIRESLPALISPIRIEPCIGQIEADHDPSDDYQNNRDQKQLDPTKGCCNIEDLSPVDFATKPMPRQGVCDQADPDGSANQIAELQHQRCDIGDFADNVPEMNDRVFDISLQLENKLSDHIAELLHRIIVHVRRPTAPLAHTPLHALSRFLSSLSRIGLPHFADIEILVQSDNHRIVGKCCSK